MYKANAYEQHIHRKKMFLIETEASFSPQGIVDETEKCIDKYGRLLEQFRLSNSNKCHGFSIRAITNIQHTSLLQQLYFSCLYR